MDPTSLERLAALKRQLPQQRPLPDHGPAQRQPMGRHWLKTTRDPDQLFGELISASPDGHVPAHLLKRLRSLEQQRSEGMGGQANQNVSSEQAQYNLFAALLGEDEEQ